MLPSPRVPFGWIAFGLVVSGCNTSGSGTIRGVHYEVALEGSYKLHVHSDREQVWIPSDNNRPFIAIHLSPRARDARSDSAIPCDPKLDDSEGRSVGAFLFVRAGDSAELKAFAPPLGVSISTARCIAPGDEGLTCSASFNDGELPPERQEIARRICKSLVLR